MKTLQVKTANNRIVKLTKRIGRGGEGTVYAVSQTECAKLYLDGEKAKKTKDKIDFMIKSLPDGFGEHPHFKICWPSEMLYDTKTSAFVGYLMPMAFEKSISMYAMKVSNFETDEHYPKNFRVTYDRSSERGFVNRIKVLVNLAAVLKYLHDIRVRLVDMKPDNILVNKEGAVSIIDTDSFEIPGYFSRVISPEYAPPEAYRNDTHTKEKQKTWDYFSFAIIAYEFLFGIHPFAGSFKSPYDVHEDIASKIRNGLYVHGAKKRYLKKSSASPHDRFETILPKNIRKLFNDTLNTGVEYPEQRAPIEKFGEEFFLLIQHRETNTTVKKKHKKERLRIIANVIKRFFPSIVSNTLRIP